MIPATVEPIAQWVFVFVLVGFGLSSFPGKKTEPEQLYDPEQSIVFYPIKRTIDPTVEPEYIENKTIAN